MRLRHLVLCIVCAAASIGPSAGRAEDLSRATLASEVSQDFSAKPTRKSAAGAKAGKGLVAQDRLPGRSFHFPAEDVQETGGLPLDAKEPLDIGTPASEAKGGYRLNFEKAEIKDVIHAVLNTTLGLNYSVSGEIAGQITISSPRPLTRDELLSALESALAGQGISLTRAGTGYRIAPNAVGSGSVNFGRANEPGFGVSIVPLRYVSGAVMSKLISGFVTDAEGMRFDTSRNTMIVRGPAQKRQEAVNAILSFDADWMRGQSVSLFEVRRARPEAVVAELTQVFDAGENGSGAGLIQFKPIARLRSVLAVSKNPNLIQRAETFIRKLDSASESAEENVFVYKARYRDARDLARVVNGLFGNGQGGLNTGTQAGSPFGTQSASSRSSAFGGSGSGSSFGSGGASGSGGLGSGGMGSGGLGSGSGSGGGPGSGSSGMGQSVSGQNGTDMLKARFASLGDGGLGGGTSDASSGMAYGGGGAGGGMLDLTQRPNTANRVAISVDPSNNAVITYANGENWKKIHAALRQLDSRPPQVAINVTIAEIKLTDQLKYGLQFYLDSKRIGAGGGKGSIGLVSAAAGVAPNLLKPAGAGFNFLGGNYGGPDVVLSALDGFTDVKVLSSPSLVVVENQPATLQVGDEVPITTRQAQSVLTPDAPLINQVDFRDTGIILNVIPRIGDNDAVTLQIEQEISAVVGGSDTLTPTISKRRVASMISVNNGQTVLLAGLISDKKQRSRDGIPFLDRIPNVGGLFGSTDNGAERTELVVFIRPVVVRNGRDAQVVTEDYRGQLLDSDVRRGGRGRAPVYKQ